MSEPPPSGKDVPNEIVGATARCHAFAPTWGSYVVEGHVPDGREDDSNDQEGKTCHKNTAVVTLLGLAQLTGAVINVELVAGPSHGDERQHDVSQNEADTNEGALATDEQHARDEGHQDTRDEEGVRQDLEIDRRAVGEKALGPDHQKRDHRLNANTNGIFDEFNFGFLFHGKFPSVLLLDHLSVLGLLRVVAPHEAPPYPVQRNHRADAELLYRTSGRRLA